MRFGAVIFDDVYRKSVGARKGTSTNGWCSIDGKPARRIVSISELESDVKWWTNLEFGDFMSAMLGRHPNVFFSGFLRTEFKALSYELGCGVEQLAADKCVQVMATIFGRVMRLSVGMLKINLEATPVGTASLTDMISARNPSKNKIPDEANSALQHAYQVWTSITQRLPKDWKSVTLRRPRYAHAIDILSTEVPSEHRWKYVDSSRLPTAQAERLDWIIGHDLPALVNVVVKPRRGDYMELINYNGGATLTRSWVCQPELLFLSQFCDIEIIGAFVCEAGFEHQKETDAFPSLGDFSTASFSLGLVTESFWMSLANPRLTMAKKRFYLPRAVWYRAMDRITMFTDAAKLKSVGFQISGYGNGSVLVCYPHGATEQLINAADELGLDMPTTKFAEVRTEVRLSSDE